MKECIKCNFKKESEEFYKDSSKPDGLRPTCKICYTRKEKERSEDPDISNRKKATAKKSYRKRVETKYDHHRNIENTYRKNRYDSDIEYRQKVIFTSAENKRKRRFSDPAVRAIDSARSRPMNILKKKNNVFSYTLGCDSKELKAYLESKFRPGMTWDNYGEWEIDHVKPLSLAYKEGKESFINACKYTNLQPIWHEDHVEKTKSDMKKLNKSQS